MRPIATRVRRSVVTGQIATQLDARRLRLARDAAYCYTCVTQRGRRSDRHTTRRSATASRRPPAVRGPGTDARSPDTCRKLPQHRYVTSYFFFPARN